MKHVALLSLLFASAPAFAMPCDTGYICKSSSGRYEIEIQHCRYDNDLHNISTLKINGVDWTGKVSLGPAWDGDALSAFQVNFPTSEDHERILSVEWLQSTGKGTIRDKSRDDSPAPFRTDRQERISCVDEG